MNNTQGFITYWEQDTQVILNPNTGEVEWPGQIYVEPDLVGTQADFLPGFVAEDFEVENG